MKDNRTNSIFLFLSNIEKGFLCDYIWQTAQIVARSNMVIIAYYTKPHALGELIRHPSMILDILGKWSAIISSGKNGIFECEFLSLLPFQRIKLIYRLNRQMTKWQIKFLLWLKTIRGNSEIYYWIFHPSAASIMDKDTSRRSLYDCVDYIENLKGDSENNLHQEKVLLQKVRFAFANSKSLAQSKYSVRKDIEIVPCGCVIDFFSKKFDSNSDQKKFLDHLVHPIIGFHGYLDYRIDFALMEYLVRHNPNFSFVFLGKVLQKSSTETTADIDKLIGKLLSFPNFHVIAPVDKTKLKSVLAYFDAGIIPYNLGVKFVYYSNPMKFYEYMAMGIPVVSVPIPSLLNYKLPTIQFAKDHDQFHQKLHYLLDHPALKTKYKKKEYLIARKNSWEEKVNAILQKIY